MAKTKILSPVVAKSLIVMLTFVANKLKKVGSAKVDTYVEMLFAPIKNTLQAVSDNNADNAQQIEEILVGFVNKDVIPYSETELMNVISKFKDENTKQIGLLLLPQLLAIPSIYTDKNPDNTTQMELLLQNFINDERTHDVVLNNLLGPILHKKNEGL